MIWTLHEIVDAVSTTLCGLLEVSLMQNSRGWGGVSIGTRCSASSKHTEAFGDIGDAHTGVWKVCQTCPTSLGVAYSGPRWRWRWLTALSSCGCCTPAQNPAGGGGVQQGLLLLFKCSGAQASTSRRGVPQSCSLCICWLARTGVCSMSRTWHNWCWCTGVLCLFWFFFPHSQQRLFIKLLLPILFFLYSAHHLHRNLSK